MSERMKKRPIKKRYYISLPVDADAEFKRTLKALGGRIEDELIPAADAIPGGQRPAHERLKTARSIRQLTQKQISDATGIARHHISEMEHGKRTIGKSIAQKLGKALDFDYRLFL